MSLETFLTLSQQAGASDAEVFGLTAETQLVSFEANRLKQIETSQSDGIGLRVWHQGRSGIAVAYGPVDPQQLVEQAIALSALGQEEEPLLATDPPATWHLDPLTTERSALIELGQDLTERIRQAYPEVLCQSEWTLDRQTSRILNTRGLEADFTDYSMGVYAGVEWVRGDDFLEIGSGLDASPRPGSPAAQIEVEPLVQQLLQRLSWAQHTWDPPSGQWPVIFTPHAADTLLETLGSALNGRQIWQKASPWSEKIGSEVVSPLLTVVQDPLVGSGGSPFDDEGVSCRPLTYLQAGRLESVYCDQRIAGQLGLPPTGNGFRGGLGSSPAPGVFNLILPAGSVSFEHLVQQMGRGLIVDLVRGGGGGLSGEFSFNVDLGFWVESGEIVGRVKDTMVAGNAYAALQNLVLLGGDREWTGVFYTPALWIGSVSVTARG